MLSETNIQDLGVPSPTVKTSFHLILTLVRANMEDHSQQSRLKMSKHSLGYLLPVLFFCCSLPTIVITVDQLMYQINEVVNVSFQNTPTPECYLNKFHTRTSFFTAVVLMPIYELVVYPVLKRHFSWIKNYFKIFLGVLFQIARVLVLMESTLKT